ncbi:MAG TPA: ABC transporter substrate-binding protein [bacterium]|nr:ABC transporter substrate-binding protein [bacterium]
MTFGLRRWIVCLIALVSSSAALSHGMPVGSAAAPSTRVVYGLPTAPPGLPGGIEPYFALERGFFKQEGLDVEIVPLPGSVTVVRALLSRQVDIALTDPATVFLAYANGAPIKIISGPVERATDVVVAAGVITSVADLRGKRFGISQPGGQTHNEVKLLAAKYGVNPDDIQYLAIGGPVPRVDALLVNRVDATSLTIAVVKPVLDAIDAGKVHVIASLGDEFPDLPTAYDITRDDVIRERPAILSRLVRADIRGYRWAAQNPDAAAQIVAKYIAGLDPALAARGVREVSRYYGVNGGVSAASVAGAQRLLVQLGILRGVIDVNQIFTPQFVTLALGSLGVMPR